MKKLTQITTLIMALALLRVSALPAIPPAPAVALQGNTNATKTPAANAPVKAPTALLPANVKRWGVILSDAPGCNRRATYKSSNKGNHAHVAFYNATGSRMFVSWIDEKGVSRVYAQLDGHQQVDFNHLWATFG